MKLSVRIDAKALGALMELGGNLQKPFGIGVRRVLLELSNQIGNPIKPGKALNPRSGMLAKAWQVRGGAELNVSSTSTGAKGELATNNPYARIQDEGGTVVPTTAQWLAIPVGPAKTAAGVSRFQSPRQVQGLFVLKSKNGNLLLVAPRGKDAITVWYILKKSVKIPASHYLDLAAAETDKVASGIVDAALQEEIDRRIG